MTDTQQKTLTPTEKRLKYNAYMRAYSAKKRIENPKPGRVLLSDDEKKRRKVLSNSKYIEKHFEEIKKRNEDKRLELLKKKRDDITEKIKYLDECIKLKENEDIKELFENEKKLIDLRFNKSLERYEKKKTFVDEN